MFLCIFYIYSIYMNCPIQVSYLQATFAERAFHHVKDLISSAVPGINGHNDCGSRGQNTRLTCHWALSWSRCRNWMNDERRLSLIQQEKALCVTSHTQSLLWKIQDQQHDTLKPVSRGLKGDHYLWSVQKQFTMNIKGYISTINISLMLYIFIRKKVDLCPL